MRTSRGNYIDVDMLDGEAYDKATEGQFPEHGLLVTEGIEGARAVLEAFPEDGYLMGDALALRDLILKFNEEHGLMPTTL